MRKRLGLVAIALLIVVVSLVCLTGAAFADEDCLRAGSPPNDNGNSYGQTVPHDGDGSGGDQVRWAHGKNAQ